MTMPRTAFRTCSLCEAMCGLKIEVDGDRIVSVRGDPDDVFSRGYVCPKGVSIGEIHHDPDRLRVPVRRVANERFEAIGWSDAFDLVAARLKAVRRAHGGDAIAVYLGNPIIHNYGVLMLRAGFVRSIGTHNRFGPSSQDTSPRYATSYLLYGSSLTIPVPDIDRTHYVLCIGANPWVSNGSFMTAPDIHRRLRALRGRGGKIVVVDPRRTETAREADEWVPIKPGGDAALLLAMAQTLIADGRVDEARIAAVAEGWSDVRARLAACTPERMEAQAGIPATTMRRLANEFADAETSVAYSRVGVSNNRYGTVATWATDVLNLVAGRLGEVGGAMFPTPVVDPSPITRFFEDGFARWHSRVRGLPETFGDLPATTLAEEIETPGPGQVRALVVYAGNPVLSVPNGPRLARAIAKLDFTVAVDIYVNETSRLADVILPPSWTMAEDHFDSFLQNTAVRNVARWSGPVVERGTGERADWEILLEIAERMGGGVIGIKLVDGAIKLARRLGLRWTPKAAIDLFVRFGPHGDRYRPWSNGLSLAKIARHPHGIDLGPLEPGISRRVVHRGRRIHLAPPAIMAGLTEVEMAPPTPPGELRLIGRRDLRSNNSWMHNVANLAGGRDRCVLLVHPEDAARAGVRDGLMAVLESRIHRGLVPVHVTDEMAPGVVSLPHGWGHSGNDGQSVAAKRPGVSINDWTDDADVESVVGQSILNGVPVRLSANSSAHGPQPD
jgi:anaerobic selenocysteine-containing dehydrogenase